MTLYTFPCIILRLRLLVKIAEPTACILVVDTRYRVNWVRIMAMPCPVSGPAKVSEGQVIRVWQHHLRDGTELVTEAGEPIKIVYPGRVNDGRGADFRDAVIVTTSGLIKGDIEVHVKSSGWRAHRHHLDAAYNRVILHVVMWHDTKTATNLQNGNDVPTLALYKHVKDPAGQWADGIGLPTSLNMRCFKATERLTIEAMAEFLDNAGEERFFIKVVRLQVDLARMGASQCLYQGIMGALGYSKNNLPFLELARRLPLQVLESVTQGEVSDEEYLARRQALLLGTAGLLPSQRPNPCPEDKLGARWIDKLERLWTSLGHTEVMSADDWHLFKVRPSNSPIRRIVAMSYLILRYREMGIVDGVVNMVKELSLSQGHSRLEKELMVTTDGYGATHFDFGLGSGIRSPTLLGSQRAADIAVNVLLPFIVAWSRLTSQSELGEKSLTLYHHYPRLAVNAMERHMRNQLGLSGSLVSSARRQQGLIHIYKTRCSQGRCNCCPLSQLEAGNHIQS